MTDTKFAGKPECERPAVWHALADQLIADGWLFDTDACEWQHGDAHPIVGGVGFDFTERGRICWSHDERRAWLRHPGLAPTNEDLLARRSVGTPDSHHIEVDV